ncbi:MAG: D-cysteine desulfhydrase family protein [Candidatus Saccharimonas sp.]|nr:D-cysteine desulfhydrase family protein [Planctomycetaceae bacterium]
MLSTVELRSHIARVPRTPLAHLPTPLELLPRFSQAVSPNGPRVWIKRDDCTGLLFGGNKARHNEFLIADALAKGADLVVWGAGVQSNNCRQTAAACAKVGLDIHLVLGRGKPAEGPDVVQGNLLLDLIVGASYEIVEESVGPALDRKIAEVAERFRATGRKVYLWDRPVVLPLAALSYAICMAEIVEQSTASGFEPAAVYVSSAGSTGAGVALGAKVLGCRFPVKSIAPMTWPWNSQEEMSVTANRAAELARIHTLLMPDDILFIEDYLGPGYGKPSDAGLEAMTLLARTEGILVEPVYTAKALAGLIDHIRQDRFRAEDNVVFLHTGGTPAIFAEAEMLSQRIPRKSL